MPDEASALVDQLTAFVRDATEVSEEMRRIRDGAQAISITERSANAEVSVTVNKDGAVTAIEFGARAADLAPARLSAITMDTIRRATGQIGERYTRVVEESGLDKNAAGTIAANYRARNPARFAEEDSANSRVFRTEDDEESPSYLETGYRGRRG